MKTKARRCGLLFSYRLSQCKELINYFPSQQATYFQECLVVQNFIQKNSRTGNACAAI